MEKVRTFEVPKDLTVDASILSSEKPKLATAKVGKLVLRVRTRDGKGAVNRFYERMPEEAEVRAFTRGAVEARMRDRFLADGGTELTLGRLAAAYPRVGVRPPQPISKAEASQALLDCGLGMGGMPVGALKAFPLVPEDGQIGISVNPKSDNGFPVLGQWCTEGAPQLIIPLAVQMRAELKRLEGRPDAIWKWVRELEESLPERVAFRGKAKADFYSAEKIESFRLRFYNALPRQVMLNMQVATQPLERLSRTILVEGHSGIGLSLVRGGADRLASQLDDQLKASGRAYVHVGDDSWVAVRDAEGVVLFSLDCSNFDLTQHSAVTAEVHAALRDELARIDRAAAELWYALMRERLVVVAGTLVRRWKHAGPSGAPLQSKVNDMLMDVMIKRLLAMEGIETWVRNRERLDQAIQSVGRGLGFSVRLEDHDAHAVPTIREALRIKPFLFVGYYFHVRGGEVLVYADVPRAMAQLPYPNLKWMEDRGEVAVMEAFRLGSTVINMGVPPACLDKSHEALVEHVCTLVQGALKREKSEGGVDAERMRWAVQDNPFGELLEPSLKGLLRALRKDPRHLWQNPETTHRAIVSRIRAGLEEEPASWADLVEEEERETLEQLGARALAVRARRLEPVQARLLLPKPPTHPATMANDGRPPPTARWGPNKESRAAAHSAAGLGPSRRARRRDGLAMREFHEALAEEAWLSEGSDDWE